MILRVYRCSVIRGKEVKFRAFAFKTRHPWLSSQSGLSAFYAGKPLPDSNDRTRCMVQIWDNAASLEAVFGPDWRDAPPLPEVATTLIDHVSVEHFEIADAFTADAPAG